MSERRGEGREESESQEANESVSADESNDGVSKEDATRPMPVLTRVKSLQDYRVMNVCCGPDYVVAHTFDNVLFGWGKNVFGILNEDMSIVEYTIHEPCQVDVPPEIRCFRQVACGGTFMVLSTGKKLYVKGNTAYCGLGDRIHESVRCITHPLGASVATFSRMLIQDTFACVAAGERHAMALAYSGVLYCWGDFSGNGRIMTTPVRVALPGEAARIGCGPSNSFMITKDRTLWVWGDNSNNQCGLSPKEGESLPTTITAPQKVALNVREFGITNDMSVVIYENGDVSLGGEASFQGDTHTGAGFEDTVNFEFDDKLVVSISPDADDVQDGVSEGTSMPPPNRAPPSSTNHTKEKDFFGVGVFPGWEVIHIMVERNRYIPK
ncbi:hypothetical protein AGDE_14349 [Angomonas deanei]|nr:hypothetical protein AGDE_14349 [Angomonas deanei]|eukprot:EPY20974.1 hypothetical protein AGDE_14349 [Angomonas deanei]